MERKFEQTWDASSGVDESEDHSSESPSDALDSDTGARVGIGGFLVEETHDSLDGDVEEEQGSEELGDASSPEWPRSELGGVDERGSGGLDVVAALGSSAQGLSLVELVGAQPHVLVLRFHGSYAVEGEEQEQKEQEEQGIEEGRSELPAKRKG